MMFSYSVCSGKNQVDDLRLDQIAFKFSEDCNSQWDKESESNQDFSIVW